MGISHEYHSAPRRRTGGGISGKLRLAGVIVVILLVAYAVTAILEKGTTDGGQHPADQRGRHCAEHSGAAAHAGRDGLRQRERSRG